MMSYRRYIQGLDGQAIDVTTMEDLCMACETGRRHTMNEFRRHHPLAGHGYTKETGWTFEREEKSEKEV